MPNKKKLIISGGRDQFLSRSGYGYLDDLNEHGSEIVLYNGGAGIDASALTWARYHGLEFKIYNADWTQYGKSAGLRRNEMMIKNAYPDGVL